MGNGANITEQRFFQVHFVVGECAVFDAPDVRSSNDPFAGLATTSSQFYSNS